MTHTLIATNTLDTCRHICAPPPRAYTQFCGSICTTQHTTYDVKGGEGGVRGRPQAPHKHPLSVELSARPPPFHVVVWVVGLLCLLCLRLGRVSITFLQVCFLFLNWLT